MSLDIYLKEPQPAKVKCKCSFCDNDHTRYEDNIVYHLMCTHNLVPMAEEVGFYYEIWRPEDVGILLCSDLLEPLERGLSKLKRESEYFRPFEPENGWGSYDGFVDFIEKYLECCLERPDLIVEVCR